LKLEPLADISEYLAELDFIDKTGGKLKFDKFGLSKKQEDYFFKLSEKPKLTDSDLEKAIKNLNLK